MKLSADVVVQVIIVVPPAVAGPVVEKEEEQAETIQAINEAETSSKRSGDEGSPHLFIFKIRKWSNINYQST